MITFIKYDAEKIASIEELIKEADKFGDMVISFMVPPNMPREMQLMSAFYQALEQSSVHEAKRIIDYVSSRLEERKSNQ